MIQNIPLITVLGPTAVGKTTFAVHLAMAMDGEIISADSRQIFREMNIGTGKDLKDYIVGDQLIPYHLIDIAEPGTEYNVYRFYRDFQVARDLIISKAKTPILCGGTGLYLESVLQGYNLIEAPINENLRLQLAQCSHDELCSMLASYRPLHNITDIIDYERLIRAIEIESFKFNNKSITAQVDYRTTPVFGLVFDRKLVRERITLRLTQRLNEGMLDEVRFLLDKGISKEKLMFYGLEYKYVTLYLTGELTYNEMFRLLNTAIHQFAKRQMTWFRRMESKGIDIFWLDGNNGLDFNVERALSLLKKKYK